MASQNTPTVEEKRLDDGGFDFLGKELDDNARIWNVYRDEVTADDKAHGFEGWLQTLDVLLIFAGLFSAVVTAFLIDSYKLLQKPDQNDFIAAALYALVVAKDNPALLRDLPKPTPLSLKPSSGERWTNALWFMSLIIALAVALLAILAKQWLQEFHRRLSDRQSSAEGLSSSDWTRKRWFYLKGITTWPTDTFITYVLPLMLHVALFLFLVGLVIFLWTLDDVIAFLVLSLSGSVFGFYVACTLLPLWFPDAPTCTPLLSQTLVIVRPLRIAVLATFVSAGNTWDSLKRHVFGPCLPSYSLPWVREQRRPERALSQLIDTRDSAVIKEEGEDDRAERVTEMLKWLIVTCTNENAVMMGFQAVSALDFDSPLIPRLQAATVGMSALTHFGSNKTPSTLDAIRAIRSELVLGRGTWRGNRLVLNVPDTILKALRNLTNPDAILFRASLQGFLLSDIDEVLSHMDSEKITTRSARLLLRCKGPMHPHVLFCMLAVLDFASLDGGDYDRVFELFSSWGLQCAHGDRSLPCLLPFMAGATWVEPGGMALWGTSLPAFIASRILRHCSQSGNTALGVRHRCNGETDREMLLDFMNHPGWLHPRVWPNLVDELEIFPSGFDFRTELYLGTSSAEADMTIAAVFFMLDRLRFRTSYDAPAPLARIHNYSATNFRSLLWDERDEPEPPLRVLKLVVVKSICFFLFVSSSAGRFGPEYTGEYTCTEALLAIAVRLSWLKRRMGDTNIAKEIEDLMRIVSRCSWHNVDSGDPDVVHLAQHIHELVPDDSVNLSREHWSIPEHSEAAEDWARLRESITTATPCTKWDCPACHLESTSDDSSSSTSDDSSSSSSQDSSSSYSSRLRAVAPLFADDATATIASEELPGGDGVWDTEFAAAEAEAALWV